jgi:hypothetical protein
LLHTDDRAGMSDYWRGYAIAGVTLAMIFIAEIIASIFLW